MIVHALSGIDVIGKRNMISSIRVELASLWDRAVQERPALGLLWGVLTGAKEAIDSHSDGSRQIQEEAMQQCRAQFFGCTHSAVSLSCLSSLYPAVTTCADVLKKAVSHEMEMPAWMNINTLRDSATGVIATGVFFFQTFLQIMWNLFMWLLDVWVFVMVLWCLVSSEVSVFAWVLQAFTTLEGPRVDSVAFTMTQKIHGVFVSLLKICLFHGLFSGVSLYMWDLSYPCSLALLCAIAALIDERLVLPVLVPSALQLVYDTDLHASSPFFGLFRQLEWWPAAWDVTVFVAAFVVVQFLRCSYMGIG